MKKVLLFLISFILLITPVTVAFSVEDTNSADKTNAEVSNPTRKSGEKPILGSGETGILIDGTSGYVLFDVDKDKRMYPASTTKIMTALLAIEAVERGETSMSTQVTVTKAMLENLDPDGTSMDLKEGEILSLESLLYGLMIPSGNDAACAIAIHIGKDMNSFVNMMNDRAKQLGAENTHFMNPNGLHDADHYTTAADMAKIAREAMKHEKFRTIVDTAHKKLPPTNFTEKERYYINTNGLVSTMRYGNLYYKYATGIKTGHTTDAGNCLVSSAKKDGVELIGVIFGGKTVTDSHRDSVEMLEWGFENFVPINVFSKNEMPCEIKVKYAKGGGNLALSVKDPVSVVAPKGTDKSELEIKPNIPENIQAPIGVGDKIGTVSVLYHGEELGSGELIAATSVERSFFWPVMMLKDFLWSFLIVRIIVYLVIIAIALFIIMFIIRLIQNIKTANKRRRKSKTRNKRNYR